MKILLVGSTGKLGGSIARKLLADNHDLRAFVRNPGAAEQMHSMGADPVTGDLKDRPSLARACQNVEVVITTANAVRGTGTDTIETVDLQGTCDLIDAARAAGVQRFVYVSAYGASMNHPAAIVAAKAYVEAYLRNASIEWTILAPNLFMDVWVERVVGEPVRSGNVVVLVGDGVRRHSMVAVADVAKIAAQSALDPMALDERIEIGGPAAISWRDVIAAYEGAYSRPIQVVQSGAVPGVDPALQGLLHAMENFDSPIDMESISRRYDLMLTSIEAFAKQSASALC